MLATVCAGDTIRLKNGRSIIADNVTDNGKSVQYAVGEDTYSIKSIETVSGSVFRWVGRIVEAEAENAHTAPVVRR